MNNKRGRPKGPEKVGLFFRVKVEDVDKVRDLVQRLITSKVEFTCEDVLDRREAVPGPVLANPSPSGASDALIRVRAPTCDEATLRIQIKALLEDVGRLTEDVERLKVDLEEARSVDLDAKGTFWRNEYLRLKATYESQFSQ